jgi:lipopolysaccharide assembly outer membrane protein LptD (OstA)
VRIYRSGQLLTGERALYNLETKILNAADFRGDFTPFRFGGETLGSQGGNSYLVKGGIFTTSDSSKPDYYLKAKTVRIYTKDRIVFSNVTLYVGRTPVFWFPYLYQSLNREQSFTITPGYSSVWGAYLLGQYTFPIGEQTSGKLRLDIYGDRGVGVGFEARWPAGSDKAGGGGSAYESFVDSTTGEKREELKLGRNWGRFRSYYIDDSSPARNNTGNVREAIDTARYRVSLQDRTYITEDIYSTIDINKLSDARFLQDFAEGEFRQNPNPDNLLALTKWDEEYTLTLMGRKQINEDQDGTDRLPDLALDIKRQPVFGNSGLFYDGESSAGILQRAFASSSLLPEYDSFRADTFHQLTYPMFLDGWLSVVPRMGIRGTYYTDSGFTDTRVVTREQERDVIDETTGLPKIDPLTGLTLREQFTTSTVENDLRQHGSVFRPVFNAGFETSFKVSKAYEAVQSRTWGLDGLRHVVQPYMNASFVWAGEDPDRIFQFDRLNRSTQLPPIDFPQFNTIDSIDNWTVVRLGVRNRFQTRRDNLTFNWLEMNTYFDVNIDRPDFGLPVIADDGTFSNIFNRIRWSPVPWVNLQIDAQLPLLDEGFTEVNTQVNFLANANTQINIGHRYMSGNKVFEDSSLINLGAYLRINDNWAFSFREAYEFEDATLESQRYELHRDLSSWVASLGLLIRENKGNLRSETDIGVLLTFTLKDIPEVRIPVSLDPSGTSSGTGKNR